MHKTRIRAILIFFCFLTLLLAVNLFNISMVRQQNLATPASNQRKVSETAAVYRGYIFDKNMIPLARPLVCSNTDSENHRYSGSLCSHLVGYVYSDGTAACGLEKVFEKELTDNTPLRLTHIVDAYGNKLSESPTGAKNLTYLPKSNLKTTIDFKIQKTAEDACDIYMKKGAVVILDIQSLDVLASVSRPDFDRCNVDSSMDSPDSPLVNKALSPYNAGSIFKIITSSAMLESGYSTEEFSYCTGSYVADGKTFMCNKTEGHGFTNFKTAFAQSCNCFFYEGSIRTGGDLIIKTAEKFGLGRELLNCPGMESTGHIPNRAFYTPRECANLGIGQGETLITPLQAAYMTAVVAREGMGGKVNLADSITDEKGNTIKNLRQTENRRIISAQNAKILSEMMRETVISGTAGYIQNISVAVAGKTGTAQTGWVENGETMTHGWFCGFFPYENPRYAMVVFAENGKSGSEACLPLFAHIATQISEKGF